MNLGNNISELVQKWMQYMAQHKIGWDTNLSYEQRANGYKKMQECNDERNIICEEIDKEFRRLLDEK